MIKDPATPQDVLRNAIEYLNMLGWHKGTFQKDDSDGYRIKDGPVCALGAMYLGVVNGDNTNFDVAYEKVYGDYSKGIHANLKLEELAGATEDALMRAVKDRFSDPELVSVSVYNDKMAKRKTQIISLFNRAIKMLDEKDAKSS